MRWRRRRRLYNKLSSEDVGIGDAMTNTMGVIAAGSDRRRSRHACPVTRPLDAPVLEK